MVKKTAKIKLLGIGNVDSFNYYVFEKKCGILKFFSDVFDVLGLEFDLYYEDEKRIKRTLKDCVDRHEVVGTMAIHKARADIFYGKDKVFLMVHCSNTLREKFNVKLGKLAEMPKFKDKKDVAIFKN